ncbi:Pyrrolidone-carboxylate peptidase [Gossypium australe]|uniref:Pyrrolidone-carboxylate peptidase n=1 Tax=Gossypium australe TaxID=47621 RepID=A0A5B6WNU4_9ROSI|nr:Pyrrolidone-carboxylate peptidase [Gossypium australe]
MGSQEPKTVTINVTGFKKFQGIAHNPTETIVNNLKNFVESKGLLPAGVTLRSCTVLETAGNGALPVLLKVLESGISGIDTKNEHVIWLHLGVDGGARKFTLEQQAVNEASFFCPDELGWQPMVDYGCSSFNLSKCFSVTLLISISLCLLFTFGVCSDSPLLPTMGESPGNDRNLCRAYCHLTTCSVEAILRFLKNKGYAATTSNDAGLFICNYVYYHSLRFAEQKGHKSLFVHVPLFSTINEETQMQFVASLLEAIASTC